MILLLCGYGHLALQSPPRCSRATGCTQKSLRDVLRYPLPICVPVGGEAMERRLAKVRKFVAPWAVYRADHDAVLPFHWACSIDGPLDRAQQSLNLSMPTPRLSPGPLTSPLAGDDDVKFLKRSASAGALQVRVWALQELCMCQSNCPLHATLYFAGPCPLRVKEDAAQTAIFSQHASSAISR